MSHRISIKAVLAGGLIDTVLTAVLVAPVALWAGLDAGVFKLPEAQQGDALVLAFEVNYTAYLAGVLLGSGASLIAGYAAARIAARDHLLNGALSAWLCLALAVMTLAMDPASLTSLWYLLLLPLAPALGGLGGVIASRSRVPERIQAGATQRISLGRRLLVTMAYVAGLLVIVIASTTLVSWTCLQAETCTPMESMVLVWVGIAIFIIGPGLLVAGPMGRLPGARHSRLTPSNEMTGA